LTSDYQESNNQKAKDLLNLGVALMTTLTVQHTVADYDQWKEAFDSNEPARRSHGALQHRVLRDGTDLLILIEFPDAAQAQSFASDPSLTEAMGRAGLQGAPDIAFRSDAESVVY
jgi:hypothetical protein